jgi:hypothetical protein
MKSQITTSYRAVRLPSSRNCNPRYSLETLEGVEIGKTRVDSSIAYGAVPKYSERGECVLSLHTTKRGNVYVDGVKKVEKKEAMRTIKFYRAQFKGIVYMGWKKATWESINKSISWIDSHELHTVILDGETYGQSMPKGSADLIKAFKA